MGHINAAVQWLIQVFNDMWPLVLATFVGAWAAFYHHRHHERKAEVSQRRHALKHALFVLNNQATCLRELKQEMAATPKQGAPRSVPSERYAVCEDLLRHDLGGLVQAVNHDEDLLGGFVAVEHRFRQTVELLKKRSRLIRATESSSADKRQAAERTLRVLSVELYSLVEDLLPQIEIVVPQVEAFLEARYKENHAALVDHLAWAAVATSVAVCGVFFFSNWAVSGDDMVRMGLDVGLVSALAFAVSLYLSIALASVGLIMVAYTLARRIRSTSLYFWSLLIALQPLVYLLWLDAR